MPLEEEYFVWLYARVASVDDRNLAQTYWKLLRLLHKKEFTWVIDKDANRAQDGKDLRKEFLRETGRICDDPQWLDYECDMLELLIAMSFKLAWQGDGEPFEWFWLLIENIGLRHLTDANFGDEDEAYVHAVLDTVINRNYARTGEGGLFPLRNYNARSDPPQQEVELWYQAEAFLLERI